MLVGQRLRLIPNKEQEKWLQNNAGVARFIYNWSLNYKIEQYKNFDISVGQKEIMREVIDMKHKPEFEWL